MLENSNDYNHTEEEQYYWDMNSFNPRVGEVRTLQEKDGTLTECEFTEEGLWVEI